MVNAKPIIIAIALLAPHASTTLAVEAAEAAKRQAVRSGQVAVGKLGAAPAPSRYTGTRAKARVARRGDADAKDAAPRGSSHDPADYVVQAFHDGPGGTEIPDGPLTIDGFDASLERNVPFVRDHDTMVGLYLPASAYGDPAWPADFAPANNVTHVFYAFMGICSASVGRPGGQTLPADARRTQRRLDARCGRGEFPRQAGGTEPWDRSASPARQQAPFSLRHALPPASQFMMDAMQRMKSANPALKTMVSVGGPQLSTSFPDMVATAAGRKVFVASVVRFLQDNPFVDGVDIAWQFPGSAGAGPTGAQPELERERHASLLLALREALDGHFRGAERKQLSAALGATPSQLAAIDFSRLADAVDFVNVMSVGLYGPDGPDGPSPAPPAN